MTQVLLKDILDYLRDRAQALWPELDPLRFQFAVNPATKEKWLFLSNDLEFIEDPTLVDGQVELRLADPLPTFTS